MILVHRFVATLLNAEFALFLNETGPKPPGADRRCVEDDADARIHRPAGASPYRAEDMLGNLREWMSIALHPYPYKRDDGREPYTGATGRVVVRGASHDDPAESLGVTRRRSYDRRGAAAGHHVVGFRCATSEDLGEMAPGGRSR
jgi:formylglycine-generating enzyme required for sulfatase activity